MTPRLNTEKYLKMERESNKKNFSIKNRENYAEKNNIRKRCRSENIVKKNQKPCQRDNCQLN